MIRRRMGGEELVWRAQTWAVACDVLLGGVAMGRSFESVRMDAKEVSERWLKASRALKKEDQVYGQRLEEMAKKHSSEAFYCLDDPLEAAVFWCWWR